MKPETQQSWCWSGSSNDAHAAHGLGPAFLHTQRSNGTQYAGRTFVATASIQSIQGERVNE